MHSFPPSFIYLFIYSFFQFYLHYKPEVSYAYLSSRTVIGGGEGGGYSLEFLVGVYRLVFQSWPYLRLENVNFYTRFQIGP